MTTLTADRSDTWYCSCGNHSEREGFAPCTEDGEECAPDDGTNGQDRDNYTDTQDRDSYTVDDTGPEWVGHYRCNRCLFVFTESDLIREA